MDPIQGKIPPARKPRLSIAQKCDLAGQAIAAIITSGLIAAPFLNGALRTAPRLETVMVISEPATLPVAATSQMIAVPSSESASAAPASPRRSRVAPIRSTFSAQAVPAAFAMKPDSRKDTSRKPLARKLAGLLVGDGSVSIRPFPTVPQ